MIIYKKDAAGNIRFLNVKAQGATLLQISGIVGTDSPITHQKECLPTNVGRSNERNPREQAAFEANALIKDRLTQGYFFSVEEAKETKVIAPMLAQKFLEKQDKIQWSTAFTQPKLDGMRALGLDGVLISRKGKVISTVPHIAAAIEGIPLHLDGELYGHGLGFQRNMELTKKHRPGESEAIKYHVYDCVSPLAFEHRQALLVKHCSGIPEIEVVPTYPVPNLESYLSLRDQFLADEYEGSMLRWGLLGYQTKKRSDRLLKHKVFQDIQRPIKDIRPSEKRPTWGKAIFHWPGAKNNEIGAGLKMSHAVREDMLSNKQNYIGQVAEIRFFEYSDTGVPRFPVVVGFREDV